MDVQPRTQMGVFEHSCESLVGEGQTKWQRCVIQCLA
jgi:hypothetical protein